MPGCAITEEIRPVFPAVTLTGVVTVGVTAAATTLLVKVPGMAETWAELVTVQLIVTSPLASGAVQVIAVVPWPAVIVPLEMVQLYVQPI